MAAAKKKRQSKPRDMSGAVEPSVRTFTRWTTTLIQQAEAHADSGNLRLVSQLCEWILADDRVQSALNTRLNALFGLDPSFEASGDKRRSNRAVKALDAGEDWWAAYPESEARQIHAWGLVLGLGPARHAWETVEGHQGRWLPMPEFWHPQHTRQDQNTKQWYTRVATRGAAQTSGIEVPIMFGDGEWLGHMPFGKNRPWSMGLWRSLAPLVLVKALAQQDWSQISEKSLILVLTCLSEDAAEDLGYTYEARKQLASDVYGRGKNAVAALPPGVDMKAIQAALKSDDIQGSLIELANESIAIIIRGGNLGTDAGEKGARSLGEVQARSGDLGNLRFDAQSWTTTIHDQSLVYWAQYNYGDGLLAPWPVYPVEPEDDRKAKGETEEKAFANVDTAEKLGFKVDRQAFLDEYKITWAKPGERPPEPEPPKLEEQDSGGPDPNTGDVSGDDSDDPKPQARALNLETRAAEQTTNGQDYADRLTNQLNRAGAKALAPTVAAMLAEIEKAESFEEVREAVAKRYEKLAPPVSLAETIDAAIIMSQLGGHLSVNEES